MTGTKALRAQVLHFVDDPHLAGDASWQYFEDGLLLIKDGHIAAVGDAKTLLPGLEGDTEVEYFANHLIVPGFIDTHIHFPQTEMIAAYGEQLLSWLNTYTFPTEKKFADKLYAGEVADVFLNELLRNGTTTALVYGTVHPQSVDAFFEKAQQRNLRMMAGKVLMDRHAPEDLCDTAESGYQDSKTLIERWHGKARLAYAVTPRFAPTSTPEQLQKAGQLLQEYDGLYMQTHLSENQSEIEWVQELFPDSKNYLDVYDRHGLLGPRSVFAHGVHLCNNQYQRLAETQSVIAHCSTSNLFLGSGLFELERMQAFGVKVGLGTDIGAGTSFSMFKTMDEAYKIQQLRKNSLDPFQAFYLATLGGARALDLEGKVGNFQVGNEADFAVLDLQATPLLKYRVPHCNTLSELLFVLNTLGDDRLIQRTYSMGVCVHQK